MDKNKQKKIRLLQAFLDGRVGGEALIDKLKNAVPTWVADHYKNEEEVAKHYEHLYGKVKVKKIGDRYYLINPIRIHDRIAWFEGDPLIELYQQAIEHKKGDPRGSFLE